MTDDASPDAAKGQTTQGRTKGSAGPRTPGPRAPEPRTPVPQTSVPLDGFDGITSTGSSKTSKEPPEQPVDVARFLQEWTELWRAELKAQANQPGPAPDGMELWRVAMMTWTDKMGLSGAAGVPPVAPRDGSRRDSWPLDWTGAPGAQTSAAASDARDAEIERLARRVDELEARLARLEAASGRSSRTNTPGGGPKGDRG
jgi:hypothetical protein